MKKLAVSTALLAASGLAAAQSTVTLFGVVDATFARGSGSVSRVTQIGSGGNAVPRIGFRGTEDLGGGLSAGFWLEAGIALDSGAGTPTSTNNQPSGTPASLGGTQGLTFNRRSTVSLAGTWGELRVGRDFAPHYYNRFTYDPTGNNGIGASQAQAGAPTRPIQRVSNLVAYHLPQKLGGLYGLIAYQFGENASNAGATRKDGDGLGARIGYKVGDFDIAVSHMVTKYASTATAGDITSSSIGARYDFGALSIMGGYFRDDVATIAGVRGRGGQIGASWIVGAGEVRAMLSNYGMSTPGDPETKKLTLGYVHNLSKRTALYGTYARVRNSGGATTALNGAVTAANQSSSGFDLGVRHTF